MTTKILFRTEQYSGSGIRSLPEIIYYEMYELGNKDIPRYILEHYQLPDAQHKALEDTLTIKEKYPFLSDRHNFETLINEVINSIGHQHGMNLRYGLWLAEHQIVQYYYGGDDGDIQAYATSPVICSNLGVEGILFAYENLPTPVQND